MSLVAIAGFGIEGRSAYRYFKARGDDIVILDQHQPAGVPDGAQLLVGKAVFDKLQPYDIVVRSPSLAPAKLLTAKASTSVTKEFFANCPAKIIGVTGTKGKGTVASLIALMLEKSGRRVHLVGNIGKPALDVLPQILPTDIVVYELSSFQLWDLNQSPTIAVVLMIEPEHLDVHADVVEYTTAKTNISAHQSGQDITIYLPDNQLTWQVANNGTGQKIPYGQAPGAYIEAGKIIIDSQIIASTSDIKLVGYHNLQNACAAVTAAWQLTNDIPAISAALSQFIGLPHRLRFVKSIAGVDYYDDSIATTPGSAIAAINSFPQPKTIILGGSDKGASFKRLATTIANKKDEIQAIILIGQMKSIIAAELITAGVRSALITILPGKPAMTKIVAMAATRSKPSTVVIMSPACASFDMFASYSDRGEQFVAAVNAMADRYDGTS